MSNSVECPTNDEGIHFVIGGALVVHSSFGSRRSQTIGDSFMLPAVPVGQSPEDKFREYLASRSRPQRYTGQQRDLVRHVFAQHNHFDAEILIEDLKKAGLRVSRATVYRTLSKLVDAGMLRRLEFGPRTFFEHDYGYPQHEHLVCQQCGRVIEFQNPAIDAQLREV